MYFWRIAAAAVVKKQYRPAKKRKIKVTKGRGVCYTGGMKHTDRNRKNIGHCNWLRRALPVVLSALLLCSLFVGSIAIERALYFRRMDSGRAFAQDFYLALANGRWQ